MSRNTRRLLALSAFHTVPSLALKFEGDDKGGGGADDKGKADKGKDAKDQPKKIELTEDELTSRTQSAVDAAIAKEREEAAAKKKKADEEAAATKAKEDGDFQKIADSERQKREAAELELANLRHSQAIDRAIAKAAAEHAEYPVAVFNEYVAPKVAGMVKVGADEKEIDKGAKEAVKAYVDANPRKAAGHTPGNPSRNTARENTDAPAKKQSRNGNSFAASRNF